VDLSRFAISLLAGVVLGIIAEVFASNHLLALVVAGVAAVVVLLVPWGPVWGRLSRIRVRVGLVPLAQQGSGATNSPQFESKMLRTRLIQVSASGLWETEPHVHFHVSVENQSQWPVFVDGLIPQGHVVIGTTSCNQLPELERPAKSSARIEPGENEPYRIRQSLSAITAHELVFQPGQLNLWSQDARVPVSLDGLRWHGHYEANEGEIKPFDDVQLAVGPICLVGPVRTEDSTKELVPTHILLYSSEWYTPQLVAKQAPQ